MLHITSSQALAQEDIQPRTEGFYSLWNEHYLCSTSSGAYTAINSDSFSEVMSIDAIADHFRGPLEPGHIAFTHNSSEAGLRFRGWRFSRVLRYDYLLKFSEDTAHLNYQLEHGGSASLDLDYRYEIYLKADHLRSRGYTVGKTFKLPMKRHALLDIELSWLESRQFYDGYAEGTFERGDLTEDFLETASERLDLEAIENIDSFSDLVSEGEALQVTATEVRDLIESSDLWLETDYAYYKPGLREDEMDSLEDVHQLNAHGKGYTLSLQLYLPITPRWHIQVGARDLWSKIKWRDSGMTEGSIHVTDAGVDAMDIIDQFIQQDIINRFSGQDFSPLNPNNPDDPEAVIPELTQQIEIDNSDITAQKGRYTQTLPTQYSVKTGYQLTQHMSAEIIYNKNELVDFWGMGVRFWNLLYLGIEPESDAYRIGLQHRFGTLMIRSDQNDIEGAKRLSIAASLNLNI